MIRTLHRHGLLPAHLGASFCWLLLWCVAAWLLPWYKIPPTEQLPIISSSLGHILQGRTWLIPVALLPIILLLSELRGEWLHLKTQIYLAVAACIWMILQASIIGLRGPAIPIEFLFPQAALGQTGLSWGGILTGVAIVGWLSDALARQGFCKGDKFAASTIIFIVGLLSLFVFFPIIKLSLAAFQGEDGQWSYAPFINRLMAPDLWRTDCITGSGRCGVVINSINLGVMAALISTTLGLCLALMVARTGFRFKKSLRAISILPIITPPFVVGVALIVLFGRSGLITLAVADWFDIAPTRWLYGLPGILMAQVLSFTPVTFLVLLGALEAINPSLEEASKTLGAKPLTTFRTVTLPLLRPGLAAAFLLAFIESISDFGNPLVLGGGYEVLSTKIFFAVVGARYDLGNAAALSLVLLALTLTAFWLQARWVGRKSYITVTGKSDAGLAPPLPKSISILTYCCVGMFVMSTLGIYVIMLIGGFVNDIGRWDMTFTVRHLNTAFSMEWQDGGLRFFGSAWESLKTTLLVAGVAAPLTTAIGILTAWLVARQDFLGKRQFEFGTMLSFAIPGTVVGVSYVAAFNIPPIDMTGTMAILVICFVFRNMPVGMRAGIAALAQIDRSMEEASLTLGAGGAKTFRSIVLPLVKPALFTALVYSFVTAMTAVSAVIFLVSARHNMATAYIMGRVENGEYALAITYSTVLMLIMIVCITVMGLIIGQRKLGRRGQPSPPSQTPLAVH